MAAGVLSDFAAHASLFRERDEERTQWFKQFEDRLSEMAAEIETLREDNQMIKMFNKTLIDSNGELGEMKKAVASSSFVLVLLDADANAYVFNKKYYMGPDGGQKAANDRTRAVREYLSKLDDGETLSQLPVCIKAVAYMDGLSQFLARSEMARSVHDFAKGFSQAKETCDFVFVGAGKDRADEKIKGVFDQFVGNPTCRHIVFGACHDNGYVRLLEKYNMDRAVAGKVTLLVSNEIGREFSGLQYKMTEFPGLFMRQGTTTTAQQHHHAPADPATGAASAYATKASRNSPSPVPGGEDTVAQTAPKANCSGDGKGWGSSSPRGATYPFHQVQVDKNNRRVDLIILRPRKQDEDNFRRRPKNCNDYHLRGECCRARLATCPSGFSHEPLTEGEMLVYRRKMRMQHCRKGYDCRDPKCYYRHS